jgi:hypothetical protein
MRDRAATGRFVLLRHAATTNRVVHMLRHGLKCGVFINQHSLMIRKPSGRHWIVL